MPMPAVPSGTHQQPFSHPQNAAQPNLSSSLDAMHLASGPQASLQPAAGQSRQRHSSEQGGQQSLSGMHRDSVASSSASSESSSLNVQLPDLEELGKRRDQVFAGKDDRRKAAWCKEVFKYIERKLDGNRINDPSLVQYVDQAINFVNRLANAQPPLADALYLRGDLLASGSFPSYHQKDLRAAFSDFELSARMGYAPSWFRIGRDYEVLGDMTRSRDAYERGCSVQDVGCIYRMGMANLLGQLELGIDHGRAIPLLKEAADLSSLDTPQPSYVYGMLLAGEFSHVKVDVHLLVPQPDPSRPHHAATRESEARRRIQRAAYFNFAPAQYRMGWLHEYAQLECAFDPLLSVQYYSLASQGGEVEADLALSKWFLCGAEGCFDKNEALAFTFADKAAAKGLASAEFAMGYFFEVGVGCEKDLNVAKKWYHKASARGSSDAKERLNALAGPEPESLSRKQHEARVDTQLQRKRTEAKMMSDRRARANASEGRQANVSSTLAPTMPAGPTKPNPPSIANAPPPRAPSAPPPSMDLRRKKTMRMVEELAGRGPSQGYRPEIASAPPPPQMPVAASPVQANLQSSSPKRRPAVNQLARPAQPPAESNYPSRLTTPGPPRRGSATPSPMPTPPIRPTMPSTPADTPTSGRSSANKAGIPVQSAPSMGPDKKVYETFGEMGFNSQASRVSGSGRDVMC